MQIDNPHFKEMIGPKILIPLH